MPPNNEDLKRFFELYEITRSDILRFELECPKGPRYAAGFLDDVRNAFDDYVMGWIHNNDAKKANGYEHLSIANSEALELMLMYKMREINKIAKRLGGILGRLLFPRCAYNYVLKQMPSINNYMTTARENKSSDHNKARDAYLNGIEISNKIIEKYYSWEIPGMATAEHRINHIITAIITLFGGLGVAFILWLIGIIRLSF